MSQQKYVSGKSKRRQEKKLRNNDSWNEINALSQNIRDGLGLHYGIATALRMPGIQANLPDPSLVASNLRLLQRDLDKLHTDLNETSARHQGYSGSCRQEDVQLLIDILSRYQSLSDEYQANVHPVAGVIYAQIAEAEKTVIAKAAALDAEKKAAQEAADAPQEVEAVAE